MWVMDLLKKYIYYKIIKKYMINGSQSEINTNFRHENYIYQYRGIRIIITQGKFNCIQWSPLNIRAVQWPVGNWYLQ